MLTVCCRKSSNNGKERLADCTPNASMHSCQLSPNSHAPVRLLPMQAAKAEYDEAAMREAVVDQMKHIKVDRAFYSSNKNVEWFTCV